MATAHRRSKVVAERHGKFLPSTSYTKLEGDTRTFYVMGAKGAKTRPTEFKKLKPDIKKRNPDDAMMVPAIKKR